MNQQFNKQLPKRLVSYSLKIQYPNGGTMSQTTNYKSELVGVFGHPVAENPTIVMQEAAFRATDLNWRYLNIEVFPQDLEAAMHGLRAMNMQGINLTIPHKVAV